MPSHPDRVRRNYPLKPQTYWCTVCNEDYESQEELDKHLGQYLSDCDKYAISPIKKQILDRYSE